MTHDYVSYPGFGVGGLEHVIIGPSPDQKEKKKQYSTATKGVLVNLAMITKTFAKMTTVFDNDGNPIIQWGCNVGDAELF